MKKLITSIVILFVYVQVNVAQVGPEISSWVRNTTNAVGYNNILANVQKVQYSASQVYISCNCIPGYNIGPWVGQPNVPSNQNFVFKITRNPQQNTGTPTKIGLGHIGVWVNGVTVFNVSDAQSYNNAGVWNRNAYYWEYPGFDQCLGHPQQQGEYHNHVSPKCVYNSADSTHHSPIIGYAFDGFPIYGAYAYANTNGTGAIKRMVPSYAISTATTRTNGPAVASSYPAGCFIEDYIYTANSGDLDERNGRYCKTPEYPNGTYAYFVTIDAALNPVFPYTFYGTYYGVVQAGNTGMGSGVNTISEPTTIYNGTATGAQHIDKEIKFRILPNPSSDYLHIYMEENSVNNITATIFDATGKLIEKRDYIQPTIAYTFNLTDYKAGVYFLHLQNDEQNVIHKFIKQ